MRIKLACLTLAAASLSPLALPAAAQQSYNSACNQVKNDRQVAGAVLGGLAGGFIGNQSAGRGARDEGTALGLVVGSLIGSQVAKGDVRCPSQVYGAQNYQHDPYASQYGYDPRSSGYGAYPATNSSGYSSYPYDSDPYRNGPVYDAPSRRIHNHQRNWKNSRYELAGRGPESYNGNYELAGRECADAKQITRLPDGTEIHRPIEACREAYYGEWSVED